MTSFYHTFTESIPTETYGFLIEIGDFLQHFETNSSDN